MAESEGRPSLAVMRMSPLDNVVVSLRPLKAGETVTIEDIMLTVSRNIAVGQKLAARSIAKGELIVKYNCPIGTALRPIGAGEHVHTHNVESAYLPISIVPK
jgi:altronate hydrolase